MNRYGRPGEARFRARLAGSIVGLSIIGVIAISLIVILVATPHERSSVAEHVFTSILPLFGTWVGTILAFYFARENLEAATQSTLRLTERNKPDTPVMDVMIPRRQMIVRAVQSDEQLRSISIESIAAIMRIAAKKRVPIVDSKGATKLVIHESLLDSYAKSVTSAEFQESSIADLLADFANKKLAEAIGFIPIIATMGDARDKMQEVDGCNDVFVTASGRPDEPAIGWLTNSLLATID